MTAASSGNHKRGHASLGDGIGYTRTKTTVSCVVTRFRLRSVVWLLPFYLSFRRVRRRADGLDGLLEALFLVENLRTCYTLSIWRDDASILEFNTQVRAHTDAANSAFGPTWRRDLRRPEIWSAQFRLWAVSTANMNWEGLELGEYLRNAWIPCNETGLAMTGTAGDA